MVKDNINKKNLLELAYMNGYSNYEFTKPKHIFENPDNPTYEDKDMLLSGSGSKSWKQTVWKIEDKIELKENEGWDTTGTYHIFEDSSIAYEKGAMDALENEDYNPDSIHFLA